MSLNEVENQSVVSSSNPEPDPALVEKIAEYVHQFNDAEDGPTAGDVARWVLALPEIRRALQALEAVKEHNACMEYLASSDFEGTPSFMVRMNNAKAALRALEEVGL